LIERFYVVFLIDLGKRSSDKPCCARDQCKKTQTTVARVYQAIAYQKNNSEKNGVDGKQVTSQ
jgi:hypothetical protein